MLKRISFGGVLVTSRPWMPLEPRYPHHPRLVAWEQVCTLRVVHSGRSTCHAIRGRGDLLNRPGLLSFNTLDAQVVWEALLKFRV